MDIDGFDDYVVNRICVLDKVNQHSECMIELSVENEKFQSFLLDNQVGSKTITASIDGQIVFAGTIRCIDSTKTYLRTNIRIIAKSYSDHLDSEIHNRVFQNPKKTYGKISSFFSDNKVVVKCVDESLNDEQIENILIQHNETDFDFLHRIFQLKQQNMYIINDKKSSCYIEINEKRSTGKETIKEEDIIKFSHEKHTRYERVKICTNILLDIGSFVEVFGDSYLIASRELLTEFEKNEMRYSLVKNVQQDEKSLFLDSFSLGLAKVVNNSSEDHLGKIQVEFIDYEDVMNEEKIWIDYMSPLTEKGGGMIALPDQDEIVEVLYRNNQCVAIGCIRNTELDEDFRDLNKRYFSSRGCTITSDEKSLDIVVDKNNIKVSDTEMIFNNGNLEVVINEDQCKIGYDDTKILMEKDTIQIYGKSKIDIQANSINSEGKNAVKVKTKSFDVG